MRFAAVCFSVSALLAAFVSASGCTATIDDEDGSPGTEGAECTADGKCAAGLSCLSYGCEDDLCLPADCASFAGPPVCGHDGEDYENACLAYRAGVGVFATGACALAREGSFRCGTGVCDEDIEYCHYAQDDGECATFAYTCTALFDGCNGVPSCDCVELPEPCDNYSCTIVDGDMFVECTVF
ncbi:MAG: hypothetical protein HOW73_26895 [Polyangiaceae bacterium]|nr:hypothetical protein [Polyangiaceae bacterium]